MVRKIEHFKSNDIFQLLFPKTFINIIHFTSRMALTTKQKHPLKALLNELKTYRGRHTELVSVYIPHGYDMNKIIAHLSQEQGTATNIKSTSTRKNVIDALEKMIQHLKLFKKTPEHGLAAFSGQLCPACSYSR